MDEQAQKVIESPDRNSKMIIKGPTGCGKSTVLFERYRFMVENLRIPSEKILVLLPNRPQQLDWAKKNNFAASGALWHTTYYNFIKNEIKLYYPLVIKHCAEIMNRRIKPLFLNFDCAQYLISKVIENQREANGVFASLVAFTDRISADLTANYVMAATSDIPYNEIGERLYNALNMKDEVKKQVYNDADKILSAYRKKCLEIGIFDFGMSVELYTNCLMKDEVYKSQLLSRVQHLIVDCIEECVPSETDFVEFLIPEVKTCLLGYNHEGGFGQTSSANHDYMRQRLMQKCHVVEIKKSHTCKDFMVEFSDMLFNNVENHKGERYKNKVEIERTMAVELRSEMLERLGERICGLIEEGCKPSDIAIISTFADPVTEYVIAGILEKKGNRLKNISGKSRIPDNALSKAIITFTRLCHPLYHMPPTRDEIRELMTILFNIDAVRSSVLAGQAYKIQALPDIQNAGISELIGEDNVKKYVYIFEWIRAYTACENPMQLDGFLQKAFLEIFISKDMAQPDISRIKALIDSARNFIEVVTRFNMNANRGFLDMIFRGIKGAGGSFEPEECTAGEFVVLSTPKDYLSSSFNKKIVIITSLSSKNWSPRVVKELTNPCVLTKTWDTSEVYSEQLEDNNRKHQLGVLIRAILKRCGERVITFESNLSANGFENDGELAEYFSEILN